MTHSKLILTASVAVLMLGAASCAATAAERGAPAKDGIVLAAEDSAKGSGKMGEDTGTQSGDEATTPENDTQKIDQPARRNPTTGEDSGGEDDVMPPAEDEDEGAPADDGENQNE